MQTFNVFFCRYTHSAHHTTCFRSCRGSKLFPVLVFYHVPGNACLSFSLLARHAYDAAIPFLFVIDIVNGGWNSWQAWGAWSSCDRACGRGRRVRYGVRECNNPSPKNGGARCPGSHIRKNSGSCLLKHCPGKYSNIQFLQTSYVRWTVSPPIHQSVHKSLLRFVCLVLFFYKFIIDAQ